MMGYEMGANLNNGFFVKKFDQKLLLKKVSLLDKIQKFKKFDHFRIFILKNKTDT